MKAVTLNLEQRLYVIPTRGGFSCLGFDVCERRAVALSRELAALGETIPMPAITGTLERYHQYEALTELAHKRNTATGWRSKSELTPELIGLEGKRVEVIHRWAGGQIEKTRFLVGKTTGWIPCHLQIARRNCSSGPAVCLGEIQSVRQV